MTSLATKPNPALCAVAAWPGMGRKVAGIRNRAGEDAKWLPDLDLNQDKQIQSLLCYRYTIGQCDASVTLINHLTESSR